MANAKIAILKVGHALVAGERGEKGGAPSKDSIFGVAEIMMFGKPQLVTFGGRRGGMQKFKAYPAAEKDTQLARYEQKTVKAAGGFAYADVVVDSEQFVELLGAGFADTLHKMYTVNFSKKNVNRRAFDKVAEKKATKAPAVKAEEAATEAAPAAKKAAKKPAVKKAAKVEEAPAQAAWPWPKSPVEAAEAVAA
jgi:hypothetical protein